MSMFSGFPPGLHGGFRLFFTQYLSMMYTIFVNTLSLYSDYRNWRTIQ